MVYRTGRCDRCGGCGPIKDGRCADGCPPSISLRCIPDGFKAAIERASRSIDDLVVATRGREMSAAQCCGCGSTLTVGGMCAHCGRRKVA